MPEYKLLIFGVGGKPGRVTLDYETDEEAIASVTVHAMEHLMEIWDGDRLVKRFEAVDGEPQDDPA